MSTQRGAPPTRPRKVDGRWACKNCARPITEPRRTAYCSDACAETYSVANFPNYARGRVFERDRGICAVCGLDTDALEKRWRRKEFEINARLGNGPGHRRYKTLPTWALDPEWAALKRQQAEYFGVGRGGRWRWSLWDMDHIVAVAEGGGQCGLDGLQSVCLPCHRAKTAEMRRRLMKPENRAKLERQAARREAAQLQGALTF